MTTTLHLRGPADVLAVLPYQLGFHPSECIVAVSLHGTRMGLVQRLDLPAASQVADGVAAMMAPLLADAPASVLLLGFEEDVGQARPLLDALRDACRDEGIAVDDRLVVRGDRWFTPDCSDPRCCPPEGRALPRGGDVPAVAELVGREIAPVQDRDALARSVRPSRPLLTRAVDACADDLLDARIETLDRDPAELLALRGRDLAVWREVLGGDGRAPVADLPPGDLARAAVSLTDVDLRDALVAWLCPGTLDLDLVERALRIQLQTALGPRPWADDREVKAEISISMLRVQRRLLELCACLPDQWAVAPLTVLASFTWWRGDGALTRIALERALAADPGYRLAMLLERMVDLAIRPTRQRPDPTPRRRARPAHGQAEPPWRRPV